MGPVTLLETVPAPCWNTPDAYSAPLTVIAPVTLPVIELWPDSPTSDRPVAIPGAAVT